MVFSYHSTRLGAPFESYSEWLHRLLSEFFHIDEDWDLTNKVITKYRVSKLLKRHRGIPDDVILAVASGRWGCVLIFLAILAVLQIIPNTWSYQTDHAIGLRSSNTGCRVARAELLPRATWEKKEKSKHPLATWLSCSLSPQVAQATQRLRD